MGLWPNFAAVISSGQPSTGPAEVNLALTSFGLDARRAFTLLVSPSVVALTMSMTCCSGSFSAVDCEGPELEEPELEDWGLSQERERTLSRTMSAYFISKLRSVC